jgi:hypothetical protein
MTRPQVRWLMKAILINPFEKSLATIDIAPGDDPFTLMELHRLVGEDALDFAYPYRGEAIAVGDHSALQEPPLPAFALDGFKDTLYGRAVVIGHSRDGKSRDTKLTVDKLSKMIEWR